MYNCFCFGCSEVGSVKAIYQCYMWLYNNSFHVLRSAVSEIAGRNSHFALNSAGLDVQLVSGSGSHFRVKRMLILNPDPLWCFSLWYLSPSHFRDFRCICLYTRYEKDSFNGFCICWEVQLNPIIHLYIWMPLNGDWKDLKHLIAEWNSEQSLMKKTLYVKNGYVYIQYIGNTLQSRNA